MDHLDTRASGPPAYIRLNGPPAYIRLNGPPGYQKKIDMYQCKRISERAVDRGQLLIVKESTRHHAKGANPLSWQTDDTYLSG